MKITVVIPNFNDIRIERALRSVEAQTLAPHEILIVDGGSTNAEVLEFYRRCRADVVSEKDGGIFDALNKGVRRSSGDVVYLMGADDELSDSRVFEGVAAQFAHQPSLDGVSIGCEFVIASGHVIRKWYPRTVTAARMRRGLLPPHFSLFLRREIYDLVGPFKYREWGNVACDILWLMDLAIMKPDLRIAMTSEHHLRMEYGGASTGSFSAVMNQFVVVHRYAKANARHLRQWYLYSPVRTLSKLLQFRMGN
ncbi:MAG TPA: glycosyltransferase [Longimicrobiales bacterium]|nr:glycosyltransferase [Longimicrobiales bacterium]